MAETKMQLVDWLDDLCVRFIINLPQEELVSVERICFQVEEAQWFYEDFVRPLDPTLPSLTLRQFCLLIFRHCPLLAPFPEQQHVAAFDQFLAYKVRVPVRGAIILNDTLDEVLLVRGWKKGSNWSFPRGKINKDEDDLDCAVREVYEETGLHLAMAGLVPPKAEQKFIEVTMREQHMKLFVFKGVPQDIIFAPRTRKEIGKIEWYKLSSLPGWRKTNKKQGTPQEETMKANKFYMVAPFLQPLKRWTNEQKKRTTLTAPETSHEQYLTDDGLLVASAALEETLQQQRDQHVLDVQTPTNNSSNHLMALLGHRLQVEVTQPSFGVTSPADDGAADRLKQLLSVGQAQSIIEHHQNMAPRATNTNAVDLLAMLRQGSTSSGPPPQAAARPKTPLDQVTNTAHKPRRLSQHRTRTSEASPLRGATPDLPFSPARMAQQQQYQNSGSQSGQPPPIWAVPQFPQSAKAYEHNRDPPIARESISLASGPMVPSASQLPAPKLSTHHMSLLDAFKNGPQPSAAQRSQSFQVPQHAVSKSPAANPLLALFKGNAVQQPSNIVTTQKPRAHQALAQAPAPMPLRQAQTPQVVPAATLSGQRPNTHKDSLLSLFRTPSANAPQVVEALDSAPRSQVIRAEVALAPLTKPGNVQILSRKEKMTEENTLPVRVNMNSTATTPIAAPSSAKNIDLLNTPEIGTVRRKPRPKSPARDSPGLSDSSLGNAAATRNLKRNGRTNVGNLPVDQRPMPTQILKRPTPAASQVHTPTQSPEKEPMKPAVVKVETRITLKPTVVKTEVKPTTPKTFQPQILRRPQDASPAVPLELPTSITPKVAPPEAAIDKTEVLMSMFKQASIGSQTAQPPSLAPAGEALVLPADQKNTLLSLFAKPTIPASAMPPPRKPISPPITRPQTLSRPSSMRTDHQASLLSLFGQPKPTPTINASGQAVPSMVASPTSILSFGSNVRPGTPSSNITALKRGSISSVLSGQGEVRPRINSMTSRDGAPTPISTTDRGFLLNYLKGI